MDPARAVVVSAALLLLAGCGSQAGSHASSHSDVANASRRGSATPQLDSIAVLGHSGTTGYNSDPGRPDADATQNSWATGSNPAVDSIYQRLLATHAALKGHAYDYGVDGSDVTSLPNQVQQMLATSLPDLVIIQSIDNDISCDGQDPANYQPYATKLGSVLARIFAKDPSAHVFLVDQWAAVHTYAGAVAQRPDLVDANSGTGPCDLFTPSGQPRPKAERYLQHVVDAYYSRIEADCAKYPKCSTDQAKLQTLPLTPEDLTSDGNHLSVAGQAKMADLAWQALPEEVTGLP